MNPVLDSFRRPRALGAAVLASLGLAAARADGAHPRMTLTAYADGAEGRSVLAGRYDAAIGVLGPHGWRFKQDDLAASTNLCVAYIMTHRWAEAHTACDEAIRFAKLELRDAPLYTRETDGERVAAAYSNRAVLEWLEHRSASAADDLARAHALAPESDVVAQNLARLRAPLSAGARTPLAGRSAPAVAAAVHG